MIPAAAIREIQATACLQAAEQYRAPLLALAIKLAGNKEDGSDLFSQTVLNCHDAIQLNGFAGDKYQFYLRSALHNNFKRGKRREGRMMPVDFQRVAELAPWADETTEAGAGPGLKQWYQEVNKAVSEGSEAAAQHDTTELARQVQEEITRTFSFTDRVLWRLHVDGISARDIAAHLQKGDHTSVWRRLDKMKDYLRDMFQQSWDSLHE